MRWCGVKSQLESHSVSNKTSFEKKALCVSAAAQHYSTCIFWTLGLAQTQVKNLLKIPENILFAMCIQNSVSERLLKLKTQSN